MLSCRPVRLLLPVFRQIRFGLSQSPLFGILSNGKHFSPSSASFVDTCYPPPSQLCCLRASQFALPPRKDVTDDTRLGCLTKEPSFATTTKGLVLLAGGGLHCPYLTLARIRNKTTTFGGGKTSSRISVCNSPQS